MTPTLPNEVTMQMAQRHHRFHHYLWHRVRNAWLRLTEMEQQAVLNIDPRWVPPRPALDSLGRPNRDNNSGEDFLFMHRQMIDRVNEILAQTNDPCSPTLKAWPAVPGPGNPDYPVPEFPDSGLENVKSDQYHRAFLVPWEKRYTNPNYLRSVSLGQLGSDIEFSIHNDMHLRWARPSAVGYRPSTSVTRSIDRRWDSPVYDYLGDTYSSAVNPIFWLLIGWVSDRVGDWQKAHGSAAEIEWKGNWIGVAPAHQLAGRMIDRQIVSNPALDQLEKIDRVISASAGSEFDGFFRESHHLLFQDCDRQWGAQKPC